MFPSEEGTRPCEGKSKAMPRHGQILRQKPQWSTATK